MSRVARVQLDLSFFGFICPEQQRGRYQSGWQMMVTCLGPFTFLSRLLLCVWQSLLLLSMPVRPTI